MRHDYERDATAAVGHSGRISCVQNGKTAGSIVSSQCSVLVVDDERAVLAMLSAVLALDFEFLTASSKDRAREILTQRAVDIVLSDQYLSGGSTAETGVSLLEWV